MLCSLTAGVNGGDLHLARLVDIDQTGCQLLKQLKIAASVRGRHQAAILVARYRSVALDRFWPQAAVAFAPQSGSTTGSLRPRPTSMPPYQPAPNHSSQRNHHQRSAHHYQSVVTSPSTRIDVEPGIHPLTQNAPNYRPPGIKSLAIVWRNQMLPASRLKRSCQCCLTL